MIMSERVQTRKRDREQSAKARSNQQNDEIAAHKAISAELLDAIDAMLEANAQEFVRSYVQSGGQ